MLSGFRFSPSGFYSSPLYKYIPQFTSSFIQLRFKSSIKDVDPFGLIPILPRIEQITRKQLSRPRYVAVGDQSGGKSSLLEAIIGIEIFPKGSSMVTRRPLNLVLQHVETGFWVEFENGHKLFNLEEVREYILRENKAVAQSDVSDDPIFVKVCSPEVSNLSVVDLPGLINIAGLGQDKLLPKKIKALVKPYVEDINNIPLVVISATEDPANSNGLREVHRVPGAVERSIGVVTKIDLKKHFDDTISTLRNETYPLGFGYYGTVMRGPHQIADKITLSEMVELEKKFFTTSGLDETSGLRLGIPYLKTQLTEILVAKICPQLPNIICQLDQIITDLERNESFLSKLASEPDLSIVAKDLEFLVRELHPESSSRSTFEEQLRIKIKDLVRSIINRLRDNHFENLKVPILTKEDEKIDVDQIDPNADYNLRFKATEIIKADGSVEEFLKKANLDRLSRLFIFGDTVPDLISNRITQNLRVKHIEVGLLLSFFNFLIPKDQGKTRIYWQKSLASLIDELIEPDNPANIQNSSFSLMMNELSTFINNIKIDHKDHTKTDLARLFGKFLFEKIGSSIFFSKLEPSISHHILAENRVMVDWHKLSIALSQQLNYPKQLSYWGIPNVEDTKNIVLYGPEWTKAYFEVLIDRIAENLFRTFGVNLLNPIILECIKYSLKTFRGETISVEAASEGKKLTELKAYREILIKAYNDFGQRK